MRAPVILGWSASTITQALANVLSSGMEAAREMLITLCPWKHARESVGVWRPQEGPQGEGQPVVL